VAQDELGHSRESGLLHREYKKNRRARRSPLPILHRLDLP
jgi:hypothetical protein